MVVSVDGQQTGSYTVTASHAAGNSQVISVTGIPESFNPHDISVSFVGFRARRSWASRSAAARWPAACCASRCCDTAIMQWANPSLPGANSNPPHCCKPVDLEDALASNKPDGSKLAWKTSLIPAGHNGRRGTVMPRAKAIHPNKLAWLTDVLERIVTERTRAHEPHTLLPWNWAAAQTNTEPVALAG